MDDSRRRPKATPEQLKARQQLRDARAKKDARKQRTRQLIQMGGVLAAHGFSEPEQVDRLMRALGRSEAWTRWLADRGVPLGRDDGGPV